MGNCIYFCCEKITLNTRLVRKAGEILSIVHNYENENRLRSKVFSLGSLSYSLSVPTERVDVRCGGGRIP